GGGGLRPLDRARYAVAAVCRLPARRALRQEGLRQEESERAALARPALDRELTAQHARDLAADGEPQTRPAVAAAGRAVGLLERLEDERLLLGLAPDCRLPDPEPNPRAR